MFGKKICTKCKRGRESYMLDERSPICPYMDGLYGRKCGYYVKDKSMTVYNKILKRLKKKGSLSRAGVKNPE